MAAPQSTDMLASNTHVVVRNLAPQITTFSVPFLRFNRIKFGGRATLIRLGSGNLLLFSPVPLSSEISQSIREQGGNVRYIVAPDIEHHMQLAPYKSAYPTAQVLAPEGLREKRARQGAPDVEIDYEFTAQNKRSLKLPEEVAKEIDVEYFDGHGNREIVLLHRPTRTMIEADLLFNLPAREQYERTDEDPRSGLWTRLMGYFTNTRPGHLGQQRFIWYVTARNKASFAESAKRVAGWDFDRIIPCHGDVIETGGKDVFRRLFAWHL